jgi:uncharacterized protein
MVRLSPLHIGANCANMLMNVLENPAIGLIFFIPGRTETLRIRGTARIIGHSDLLEPLAACGKLPSTGLLVVVELAWVHCGRALIRSRLWERDARGPDNALPTLGSMISEEIGGIDT